MKPLTIDDLSSIRHLKAQAEELFAHHKFKEMQNVKVEGVPGKQFITSRLVEFKFGIPIVAYLVNDMDRPDDTAVFYYEARLEAA